MDRDLLRLDHGLRHIGPGPEQSTVESINLRASARPIAPTSWTRRPPPKLADLQPYEAAYPMAILGLREKNLEVYWGGGLIRPGGHPARRHSQRQGARLQVQGAQGRRLRDDGQPRDQEDDPRGVPDGSQGLRDRLQRRHAEEGLLNAIGGPQPPTTKSHLWFVSSGSRAALAGSRPSPQGPPSRRLSP